jgi:hypothetical protein
MFPAKRNQRRPSGLEFVTELTSRPMTDTPLSPEAVSQNSPDEVTPSETRRPGVVILKPRRFPDVLAEITRTQPLTMLAIAFIAGMILAPRWRR